MKKRISLLMGLILLVSLSVGCGKKDAEKPEIDDNQQQVEIEDGKENEIDKDNGNTDEDTNDSELEGSLEVRVEFKAEDQDEIFGDASSDVVNNIVDAIYDKILSDPKYADDTDLAIEDSFKENGITDEKNIKTAKEKITIR